MNHPTFWTRRHFLTLLGTAGAGLALHPLWARSLAEVDPRVAAIVAATVGIDAHNHVDVPLAADQLPGPDIDLTGALKKSGFAAIVMTFAVDYQALVNPGDAYERFKNGLTAMDAQLLRNGIKRSLNLADLRAAHAKREKTIIQSVEGGHFL